MSDDTSKILFERYRRGDSQAASEIFDRYVCRLIELARRRISPKLGRRIDPEDVVQSAYRSFFVRAGEGDFVLQRAGDLWRLLAGITINKVRGQVERNTALRRDIRREHPSGDDTEELEAVDATPTPADAAALAEQVELVMRQIDPTARRALELRLQGLPIDQIAQDIDRSQRTVRRLLESVRRDLTRHLDDDNDKPD